MVSAVSPLGRDWIYGLLIQPYKEGSERINRAFAGVDFLTLELRPLSFKERAVSLLTGIVLMTPLINSIVWFAMQTFGAPDSLTDPYIPPEEEPPPPGPLPIAELEVPPALEEVPVALAPSPPLPPTKRFEYMERVGDCEEVCRWKVEEFPDFTSTTKESDAELVICRYAMDGYIQDYHFNYQDHSAEFRVQKEEKVLRAMGKKGDKVEERVHHLKDSIPWIQQLTVGLKPFLDSSDEKLEFCIVNPKDLNVYKLLAEKRKTEHVPGYGDLKRVDVRSGSFFYNLLGLGGKLWFDPLTGELKKMFSSADPREHPMVTEWLQSGP